VSDSKKRKVHKEPGVSDQDVDASVASLEAGFGNRDFRLAHTACWYDIEFTIVISVGSLGVDV
jgi:hypothetical protein